MSLGSEKLSCYRDHAGLVCNVVWTTSITLYGPTCAVLLSDPARLFSDCTPRTIVQDDAFEKAAR